MSHTINMEEFQHGIRSTVLCPAEVATPILDLRPKPVAAEERARMIQPEHMADLILYVARLPATVCMNEVVISPTWNRGYAHLAGLGPSRSRKRPEMSTPRTVHLSPNDNVVVAVDPIPEGSAAGVTARARVMRGHKMAVAPIAQGRAGAQVRPDHRLCDEAIVPGDWVHTHNVEMHDFARDYRFAEGAQNDEVLPPELRATFEGYRPARRQDRHAQLPRHDLLGELLGLGGAFHSARGGALRRARRSSGHRRRGGVRARHRLRLAAYGEGFDMLRRTLWGYATHPNLGGVLMVGLGCEVFQIDRMKDEYGLVEGDHFQTMTIQATGGTKKTVAEGVERIKAMLPIAARAKRETRPASEITLALQCGGSDGYSGITANPALGAAADLLVRHGGTAILAETPEIYGAEHLLTRRAVNRAVGEKLVERIKWWEDYTPERRRDQQQPVARQQGGRADDDPREVARRGRQGRHHHDARGLRVCRAGEGEGLRVHGHAGLRPGERDRAGRGRRQRDVFTTGRGSVFGCKPTPSIKLATNTPVYASMIDDMDINCGDILDGVPVEEGRGDFQKVLATRPASAPSARTWASVTRSSCRGRSAR